MVGNFVNLKRKIAFPLSICYKGDMKSPLIAPSILSADFSDIRGAIELMEESGADLIHLDVMDGHFVPNISFGPKMVADIKKRSNLPLDVHLMIEKPEEYITQFIDAGADYLTFHIEAAIHSHRIVQTIVDRGVKPGISLVPSSPVSSIMELIPYLDLVLVMTVNPGFGGQKLIPLCLEKVRALKIRAREMGRDLLVAVDGGVNRESAEAVKAVGTDILVTGSAFFGSPDPEKEITFLKGLA
jgi:ribulose-phosphate 3-epimerase